MPIALKTQTNSQINAAWAEYISRSGTSPVTISCGWDGQTTAQMPIDVNFLDLIATSDLVGDIVGFARRSGGTGIQRQIPMRFPIFPWQHLYAQRISNVLFYQSTGKLAGPYGPYASWGFARLTVAFSALPFTVLTDQQLAALPGGTAAGAEVKRYVQRKPNPSSEALTRQGGDWTYVEGAAGAPNTLAVPGTVSQGLLKDEITLIWHQVPEDVLFDANLIATKINNVVNGVNNAAYLGYPAGTLLCLAPAFEEQPAPFVLDTNFAGGKPQRLWKATARLKWFDTTPVIGGGGATTVGHNCLPWNDNLWYKVASKTGSNTVYKAVDFTQLFTSN